MRKALLLKITALCIAILLTGLAGYFIGRAHNIQNGFDPEVFSGKIRN